ncbi:MAG TPA: hypothetical protein PLL66_02475 [Bacteroidales bacterium]|nr:hypothetical protein [Bacteroidales bacterium]
MKKLLSALVLFVIVYAVFSSCEVIYNYDLSIVGIDTLPATKSCIDKYIPHSVDAPKGRQYSEIEALSYELDNHMDEIRDSLYADSIRIDSAFELIFIIRGLDPYDEITDVEIKRTIFSETD